METENNNTQSATDTTITPKPSKRDLRILNWLFVVFTALIFGFVGGKLSSLTTAWDGSNKSSETVSREVQVEQGTANALAEDQAVISVVEKNSPGVVSIVVSKDIPRFRQTGPFGNWPFFFDPFGSGTYDENPESETPTQKQRVGSGSGFFVSSDGLIVTNKHVVSDQSADYTVVTKDGTEYKATVLARDPNNDVAVIKVEGKDFPALSLGDSDTLQAGQTAIAIGNPLGEFANSVSRGIISGLQRDVTAGSSFRGDVEKLTNIIQTDAAINPGNSGGPLLNLTGEVIGINVAVAQGAENIGFAIPVNSIKRVVEQVKMTGKISTPYLGVRYIVLNDAIKKEENLPFNYGALILRGETMTDFAVVPGSPADKAGLVENDIILEFDGKKIDDKSSLAEMISKKNVGDEVTLKVWHKGETKEIKVKLEERQQ